ncbi:MAG: SPW repeat protein [Patescibacteria group bacterium]
MKELHWVILVLGLWVLISPWILGFSAFAPAMWSNVVVGVLIIICSLWNLFGGKFSATQTI